MSVWGLDDSEVKALESLFEVLRHSFRLKSASGLRGGSMSLAGSKGGDDDMIDEKLEEKQDGKLDGGVDVGGPEASWNGDKIRLVGVVQAEVENE